MKKFLIIMNIIFLSGLLYPEKVLKHNPLKPGTDAVFTELFNSALELKDRGKDDEFLLKMKEAYTKALEIGADIPAAISMYYTGCGYIALGRFEEALPLVNSLEQISVKDKNTEETDFWLYALKAEYLAGLGRYDDIVDLTEHALKGIEGIYGRNNRFTVELYQTLGVAHYYKGNYDKLIYYTELSLKYAEKITGEKLLLFSSGYTGIGEGYRFKGDYNKAAIYHEKALAIRLKILGHKHPDTAHSYDCLGVAYYGKGEFDRAITFYLRALEVYTGISGEKNHDTARCYNNLAVAYWEKGDYNRSLEYHEKALAIRLDVLGQKHADTAQSYNGLGTVYHVKGDYDRAIEAFEKALIISREIYGEKHRETATGYNNLGVSHWQRGDHELAIEYYGKALAIRIEVLGENHPDIAGSYNNLGEAYSHKGDYDRALEYFEKGYAVVSGAFGERHPHTATAYNNLGFVYKCLGKYDRAIAYYEKSLSIFREILGEKHPNTATGYSNLGVVYIKKNEYDNGIRYLEKGMLISTRTEEFQNTVLFSGLLGTACLDVNQFGKAYSSFLTGIETIEKVRKLNLSGATDFTSRNIDSFYYAASASFLDKNMNSMFNISERMRAMGYLERLSLKAAIEAAGIDPEQGRKLLKLKDDIERLSSFRQKLISMEIYKMNEQQKKERDKQLEQASKELAQAESDFTRLDTEFMKNEKYKSLRDTNVVSVNDAQKLCGKDSAIIEYIIPEKPDKYMKPFAIIITGSSIYSVELDSKYNFSEQIDKYRALIRDNKQSDMDSLSAELYSKLIEPVNSYISSQNIKKLMIVPDGSLAFLPFDSIKIKDNKYLSDKYELNLAPSVTVSAMTRNRKFAKKDNLMAFGGGLYSSTGESKTRGDRSFRGMAIEAKQKEKLAAKAYNSPLEYYNAQKLYWSDLPGTEKEVSAINDRIYNKKNTELYTGSKVSEENLKSLSKQGKLKQYSSIHLACHGYYDPEYPAYSAVVFSEVSGKLKNSKDDGYMSVEETALLNLQSDIVVLSACETGLGKMVSGDGVIGLTRAFQVAGSNRVLVTLWPVSDEATEAFMVSFYKKVKAGMSYSQALVKVKEEFRRSGGAGTADYSAPYYWAGFVLYE